MGMCSSSAGSITGLPNKTGMIKQRVITNILGDQYRYETYKNPRAIDASM
jgi:hypothetical protein